MFVLVFLTLVLTVTFLMNVATKFLPVGVALPVNLFKLTEDLFVRVCLVVTCLKSCKTLRSAADLDWLFTKTLQSVALPPSDRQVFVKVSLAGVRQCSHR